MQYWHETAAVHLYLLYDCAHINSRKSISWRSHKTVFARSAYTLGHVDTNYQLFSDSKDVKEMSCLWTCHKLMQWWHDPRCVQGVYQLESTWIYIEQLIFVSERRKQNRIPPTFPLSVREEGKFEHYTCTYMRIHDRRCPLYCTSYVLHCMWACWTVLDFNIPTSAGNRITSIPCK